MIRRLVFLICVLGLGLSGLAQTTTSGSNVRSAGSTGPLYSGQICFGGNCTAVNQGSFGPYNVTAGTYTVTVLDNLGATILTLNNVVLTNAVNWVFDSYVLPRVLSPALSGFGQGPPYLLCANGAIYNQTYPSPVQWNCNLNGNGQLIWQQGSGGGQPIVTPGQPIGSIGGVGAPTATCTAVNRNQIWTDQTSSNQKQYACDGQKWNLMPVGGGCTTGGSANNVLANNGTGGCLSAQVSVANSSLGANTSLVVPSNVDQQTATYNGVPQFFNVGTDVCSTILTQLGIGSKGTAGGPMQITGAYSSVPCAYNSAAAPPFGTYVYSATIPGPTGPGYQLYLGPGTYKTDQQWAVPLKTRLIGTQGSSGPGSAVGTTVQGTANIVYYLVGCTLTQTSTNVVTITGCPGTVNAGGSSASSPWQLAPGNWIKFPDSVAKGGTGTCLDNAWRIQPSVSGAVAFEYRPPGSGCTPPTFPFTLTSPMHIDIPLAVIGNSSTGNGTAGYGGTDLGARAEQIAFDVSYTGDQTVHPANAIAVALWTANEWSGVDTVFFKNCTAACLDLSVPSPLSTGATGHPADFQIKDPYFQPNPYYANNPTTGVEQPMCAYINTHGDPGWYWLGGTCKVPGSNAAPMIGNQMIGTNGMTVIGYHTEGVQTVWDLGNPIPGEGNQNHSIEIIGDTAANLCTVAVCGAGNTGTHMKIENNSGYPINFEAIQGTASGGAIVDDQQSGFSTQYPGPPAGDSIDASLGSYHSINNGYWYIESPSYESSMPLGVGYYAAVGGGQIDVGSVNAGTGVRTKQGSIRGASNAFVLSCEVAGGCPFIFRPTGTSSTGVQQYSQGLTSYDLQGADGSVFSIALPSGFGGTPHTLTPQALGGVLPAQDTAHIGPSYASFASDGRLGITPATLLATNGLVGSPSITFNNDNSSGFYFSASHDIRYASNGVDFLRFLNTASDALILNAGGSWCTGSSTVTAPDACFVRSAANTLTLATAIGGSTGASLITGPLTSTTAVFTKVNQSAAAKYATTISISAATTGSFSFPAAYTSVPIVTVTPESTTALGAVTWSYAKTTTGVTITCSATCTETWDVIIVGNPN